MAQAPHSLSGNQERYLLAERVSAASFFVGVWYEVRGRLDVPRLRAAISQTIAQHHACRTGFVLSEKGFAPVIQAEPQFQLFELETDRIVGETVEQLCAPYLGKVRDFSDPAALQNYFVIRASRDHYAIVFAQHHAVTDGRSLDIFIDEVARNYSDAGFGSAQHDAYLPPTEAEVLSSRSFWRDSLADLETVAKFHRNLIGLPHSMHATRSSLTSSALQGFDEIAAKTSRFSAISAAFAAQVSAQTEVDDVVFSIQSSGRDSAADCRIGSFSNALPFRVRIEREEPFIELAKRCRTILQAILSHQALPYHQILSETKITPDFALNFYPSSPRPAFGSLEVGKRRFLPSESDYSINVRWHRDVLDGRAAYEADAYFDRANIESGRAQAFLKRHVAILECASENPAQSVAAILNRSRGHSAPAWSQTKLTPRRIFEEFRETVRAAPDRSAVSGPAHDWSYRDLNLLVEGRASHFWRAGVRIGMRVAVLAERTPDFVVNLLALSRLGVSFAAFDADYPDARLAEQAKVLQPQLILATEERLSRRLWSLRDVGWPAAMVLGNDFTEAAPLPPPPAATDIAYHLFTSGTTGEPKVVSVGHAALIYFLDWQRRTFGISAHDRVTMLSGLGHDPVMRDIFLPLTSGGTLCVPELTALTEPSRLISWLLTVRPTVMHATPALGGLISDLMGSQPLLPSLAYLFWGGDLLPNRVTEAFRGANPALNQVNFYGSTETPQAVSFHLVTPADVNHRILPIGRSIDGISIDVLDSTSSPLDVNEIGQVVVRTPYLAFLGLEPAPSPQGLPHQVYQTGDRGYLLPDGEIQLVGRGDDQVKIRGFRVELADVQKHLSEITGVTDAFVTAGRNPAGDAILMGHVTVSSTMSTTDGSFLREQLSRQLPSYMVPAYIVIHDRFPLLPNGKIDRRALAQSGTQDHVEESQEPALATLTPSESIIVDIFEAVLGRPVTSVGETFTKLGADSLSSIRAMIRLEEVLTEVPEDWYDWTVAKLARLTRSGSSSRRSLRDLTRMVRIDPAAPLRALAILSVVALHFRLLNLGGGATFVLFLLAGLSFGRYQLGAVLDKNSTSAIERGISKIALATIPVAIGMGLHLARLGSPDWLRVMLFLGNTIDYSTADLRNGVWLWFIGCYIQIFLVIIIFLRLKAVRSILARHAYSVVLAAFLVLAVSRFALPALLHRGGLHGITPMSVWSYLPNAHAGTLMLGAALSLSRTTIEKFATLILGIAYAVATWLFFPGNEIVLTSGSLLLIAFVVSIKLPRIVALGVLSISRASLYIYLLHMPIHKGLTEWGLSSYPLPMFVIAIFMSSIVGLLFDDLYDLVSRWARSHRWRETAWVVSH